MKNITRKQLDQILADHRLWLDSNRKSGKRANLSRVNLRWAKLFGAQLREANLRWTDLREAQLQGVNLQGADLSGAALPGANLYGANMFDADLNGAYLREVNLRGATLPLSIRDCLSFYRAKFSPDALPWLILHPQWSEWKDSVQIEAE